MLHRFLPPYLTGAPAVGLLLLRLVMGVAFLFHGWHKIQNPMHWMPENAPIPGILQAAAAIAEFGGGISLILGLLTPLFALLLAVTMGVGAFMVHIPMGHPFVAGGPGQPSYEPALFYLAASLLFLLAGPGALSADYYLFGPMRRREL